MRDRDNPINIVGKALIFSGMYEEPSQQYFTSIHGVNIISVHMRDTPNKITYTD
jgi:hypothetical protein